MSETPSDLDRLIHFSSVPLGSIYSRPQRKDFDTYKPWGLWVSCGVGKNSWPNWCLEENFCLDELAHATEIILRPDANIKRITSEKEIDEFHAEFVRENREGIPWALVAQQFQGIVIAPYLPERRLCKCIWYSTWDCASGCIWDADAVQECREILNIQIGERG